jgi:hypothetical protein
MDRDLKRKVEQAATIQLAASFLKIPQAMRAAGFTDEDSKSAARQMQVRRARDAMQKSTPTNVMTVTVSSHSSPAAGDSSVSTLTAASPSVPAAGGGGADVLPVLREDEGVDDTVPAAPPALEKVRLTVGASIKVVRNKKKTEQWKSKALKAATLMYHTEQQKKEDTVGRMSADEVEAAIKTRFAGTGPSARTITRYVNEYKLIGVSPVRRGSPGDIPSAAFESLCVGVESYISINQLNRNCGNNIGKKDLAILVNAVVCRNTGENKECNYKLMHRISLYKGIDLTAAKMSNHEVRRIMWTRAKFLTMWFDTWENNLVTLGFATREDGAKGIAIAPDQLVRILNFDETALSLDGSGTSAGGRPKAVFYNPNLPLVGKATSKESACTTMITGSNAAGEAIPPHFQFQTSAQSQDTEQCRLEAAAYFRGVWCKFGRKTAKYIGTSVGLNEKGGMDEAEFEKYFRNSILPLFPDALDLPGFRVMVKVDSGPGRLNVNLLAELRLLGFYLYPGVPNTTAVTQETDRNYGPFKGRFRANLGEIVDARMAAKKSISLQPWLVGLIVFGGSDEETGLEIKKCAFSAGFSKEACLSAWEKVGAAPCTRKCLLDPKVSKSLGDGDDEYYNSIQVANDHAVNALNAMGYAGHLLAAKIEDDREEAVPLTQPQSKERIEVMRRATTHTKKFLATKGEHVMTDDFFVSAQSNINEFDIDRLTKEKKKRLKSTEVDAEARAVLVKRSFAIQTLAFDSLNKTELDCLLRWHGVVPGAKMQKETKVSKLRRIFESNPEPPPRDLWTAENEEHLQSLKEMEISLEDTAVGRKKIVLEQQLNAATLNMSPTKWNELLEIRKRKWGEEEVVGASDDVIGGAEGV